MLIFQEDYPSSFGRLLQQFFLLVHLIILLQWETMSKFILIVCPMFIFLWHTTLSISDSVVIEMDVYFFVFVASMLIFKMNNNLSKCRNKCNTFYI